MRADDQFIREEVERQGFDLDSDEGKLRIVWMRMAWVWAEVTSEKRARPTLDDIMSMSYYIEPIINESGYRQGPVLAGGRLTVNWRDVPEAMERMLSHSEFLSPLRFYVEFELIHPFADGNGRVGAILYNWLNCTLDEPETPADVFNSEHEPFDEDMGKVDEAELKEVLHQAVNSPIQGADEPSEECDAGLMAAGLVLKNELDDYDPFEECWDDFTAEDVDEWEEGQNEGWGPP